MDLLSRSTSTGTVVAGERHVDERLTVRLPHDLSQFICADRLQIRDRPHSDATQPFLGHGTDAGYHPTGIGPSNATSVPGSTTRRPSGLASSLATFAMNFDVATPTEAVSPPVRSANVGLDVSHQALQSRSWSGRWFGWRRAGRRMLRQATVVQRAVRAHEGCA